MVERWLNSRPITLAYTATDYRRELVAVRALGFQGIRVDGAYMEYHLGPTRFNDSLFDAFASVYAEAGLKILVSVPPIVNRTEDPPLTDPLRSWQPYADSIGVTMKIVRRPPLAFAPLLLDGLKRYLRRLREKLPVADITIQFGNEPAWGGAGGPANYGTGVGQGTMDGPTNGSGTAWDAWKVLASANYVSSPVYLQGSGEVPQSLFADTTFGTTAQQDIRLCDYAIQTPAVGRTRIGSGLWDDATDWQTLSALTGKDYSGVPGFTEWCVKLIPDRDANGAPQVGLVSAARAFGMKLIAPPFLGNGLRLRPAEPDTLSLEFATFTRPIIPDGPGTESVWKTVDGFSFHCYAGDLAESFSVGTTGYADLAALKARESVERMREQPIIGKKPLWLTETGVARPWTPTSTATTWSEDRFGIALAGSLAAMDDLDLSSVHVFNLNTRPGDGNFGLMRTKDSGKIFAWSPGAEKVAEVNGKSMPVDIAPPDGHPLFSGTAELPTPTTLFPPAEWTPENV